MHEPVAAIHQPNFFPWLGFFDKINRADKFVYLDSVVTNPRTSTYTKRVAISLNGKSFNYSIPLKNKPGVVFEEIKDIVVDHRSRDFSKACKTFELNYKKAPYFSESLKLVENFFAHGSDLIADRNISFAESVCEALDIRTERIRASDLKCKGSSNELLIDIVKQTGCKCYMPGGGSQGYQDDALFAAEGIHLKYQNFNHPQYAQFNTGEFIKGLSILDAIANLGLKGVRSLLNNG
jgi:hypothetical protein